MTTIAYRDGVIASDTGMTVAGVKIGTVRKIARNQKGDLCGGAGSATFVSEFLHWFKNGERGAPPDAVSTDELLDRSMIILYDDPKTIIIHEPGGMSHIHRQLLCTRHRQGSCAWCNVVRWDCGTSGSGRIGTRRLYLGHS
jgi:hypothetical protein